MYDHPQQEVLAERDALRQSRSAIDAREAEQAALLATAQAGTKEAEEATRRAMVETTTLRRLVDRLEAEAKERAAERTRLLAQNEALETTCARLREAIRVTEAKSAKERNGRDEHVKAVEDRAHAEVDRVRTELKAARAELTDTQKHQRMEIQALQRTVTELTRSLGVAERETAHQRGVAEALKLKFSTARRAQASSPLKRIDEVERSRSTQKSPKKRAR